jgi:hypothetical protein
MQRLDPLPNLVGKLLCVDQRMHNILRCKLLCGAGLGGPSVCTQIKSAGRVLTVVGRQVSIVRAGAQMPIRMRMWSRDQMQGSGR